MECQEPSLALSGVDAEEPEEGDGERAPPYSGKARMLQGVGCVPGGDLSRGSHQEVLLST